jgi:histidine ammonia-lyase
MADIARGVLGDVALAPGEGLALINSSAYGTAQAALALFDAARLLDAADVAAALALEGFAANLSTLDPFVAQLRPDPVLAWTLARLRAILEGSYLWEDGAARNLQDPLTFRSALPVQAAARAGLEHALDRLTIELNAAQGNPLVSAQEGRIFSASAYEVVGLAATLDYVRVALMTAYTAASERSVKLLDTPWSGLPTGLLPGGGPDLGLSIHAIAAESLTAEATLLAQPASFIVTSTSGAEGIEDRASHLPLTARRLAEFLSLGEGIVAIELLVAAQAVDVRGLRPLGARTAQAHARIRERIPMLVAGEPPPTDVEPIRALIRTGAIG